MSKQERQDTFEKNVTVLLKKRKLLPLGEYWERGGRRPKALPFKYYDKNGGRILDYLQLHLYQYL